MAQRKFSPEVKERAVRMVFEQEGRYGSRWEAVRSIAEKIGCSAEALRKWVQQAEIEALYAAMQQSSTTGVELN
jgi:transposase-like protein